MADPADQFYEVEKVLGKRYYRGRLQYKIHYKNDAKANAQWVNETDCRCAILIKEFQTERLHYLNGRIGFTNLNRNLH